MGGCPGCKTTVIDSDSDEHEEDERQTGNPAATSSHQIHGSQVSHAASSVPGGSSARTLTSQVSHAASSVPGGSSAPTLTSGVSHAAHSVPEGSSAPTLPSPPEGTLTSKCDVYSFGVVLLEIVFGVKCLDDNRTESPHLVEWARALYTEGKSFVGRSDMRIQEVNPEDVTDLCALACSCVDRNLEKRPTMDDVVARLQ